MWKALIKTFVFFLLTGPENCPYFKKKECHTREVGSKWQLGTERHFENNKKAIGLFRPYSVSCPSVGRKNSCHLKNNMVGTGEYKNWRPGGEVNRLTCCGTSLRKLCRKLAFLQLSLPLKIYLCKNWFRPGIYWAFWNPFHGLQDQLAAIQSVLNLWL